MNASNAKDYLPLVQALAEGKEIEWMNFNDKWQVLIEFSFESDPSKCRIKAEPRDIWFNRYEHDVYHGPYPTRQDAESDAMNFATQV